MKKLLFYFMRAVATLTVSAVHSQANVPLTTMLSGTGYTSDTVTSTTAHYLYAPAAIKGKGNQVTIAFKALEIDGTTAGTATLEASIDNTVWYPYYGSIASDTAGGNYRVSLADVATAQTFRWVLTDFPDQYVRIKVVGISTPNVKISAKYFVRR